MHVAHMSVGEESVCVCVRAEGTRCETDECRANLAFPHVVVQREMGHALQRGDGCAYHGCTLHVALAPSHSVRTSLIRRARLRGMVPSLLLLSAYIARDDNIDIAVLHKRRRERRDERTKQGPTYNT